MSTMLQREYQETLDAISRLQDRLYNAKEGEEESRQEQCVNQAYAFIQEARDFSEARPAERQRGDMQATQPHSAELAVSLHFARSDVNSLHTRLHSEIADHQQTQAHLDTAATRLDEEIALHHQAETHVKQLEHLLRQEIDDHTQVKSRLSEHEILLREIHHRVKNNMTMAISLIQMQMGKLHDEEDRALFQELEHRIYTMALIHEKLYQSQYASSINLRLFVVDLSQTLLSAYQPQPEYIALEMTVEDVYLPLDKAIPCGLILNELLTNAMKYAFPDGREGTVFVDGQHHANSYALTVRDNGIGLPQDFDPDTMGTLGMRLVTLLAQTMGTLRIERSHGTAFIIEMSMDALQPEDR